MNNSGLIVDDNDYITKTLKISIEKEGYKVLTSSDGNEALECLEENLIQLVITDINMPNLNGLELIREIKTNKKTEEIPVLVLTTQGFNKEKAREIGAYGFLTKPFSSRKLLATIHKIFDDR